MYGYSLHHEQTVRGRAQRPCSQRYAMANSQGTSAKALFTPVRHEQRVRRQTQGPCHHVVTSPACLSICRAMCAGGGGITRAPTPPRPLPSLPARVNDTACAFTQGRVYVARRVIQRILCHGERCLAGSGGTPPLPAHFNRRFLSSMASHDMTSDTCKMPAKCL